MSIGLEFNRWVHIDHGDYLGVIAVMTDGMRASACPSSGSVTFNAVFNAMQRPLSC